MSDGEKARGDGVNDYYVKGERRQGITFYILVFLVLALVTALLYKAFEYIPRIGPGTLWPAFYYAISLVVGATVGIFAYNAYSSVKFIRIMLRNSLKVSPNSFPEVSEAMKLAADRLSAGIPYTFVTQSPAVNAYTIKPGLLKKKAAIALNTGLLEAMEGDELLFILGHELSHVKYGWWRRLEGPGLYFYYLISPQFNEFRCDRGGLVACGDINASTRALLKLVAGREFIDRIDLKSIEREKPEELPTIFKRLATHPMIDARIKELIKFYNSPAYKKQL